ncbi:MAG TPA: N-acyl homoserine lactonase family protein [Ktedonobacteraceae bacterium]
MTKIDTTVQRLYLLQLSTTTIPLPGGQKLEMVSGCYLIQTSAGKHVLVDSGLPAGYEQQKNVLEHLAELGLRPAKIDTVICTHFDVDHAGYHDAFPQAEFIVQRSHYELARGGHPRLAPARAHWDHPALRYRLIDGDLELLPGLTLIESSGHVTGHQSVLLRLPRTGPVLLAIDAVVMERLFTRERKAWPMDENEEQLLASTGKLLDLVQRDQVKLTIFGHDGLQWQTLTKAPAWYE